MFAQDSSGARVAWNDPDKVYVVVPWIDAQNLPYLESVAKQFPAIAVVLLRRFDSAATLSWLDRSSIVRPAAERSTHLGSELDALCRKTPVFNEPLSHTTSPVPSMAVADGVAYDVPDVFVLHGGYLVWAGDSGSVRAVVRDVVQERWSIARLAALEGIRGELDEFAKLRTAGRLPASKAYVRSLLQRKDLQPQKLQDLALAIAFTVQDHEEVALIEALADRALADTDRGHHGVLRASAMVRRFAADNQGARSDLQGALNLCRQVGSDCAQEARLLESYVSCPVELDTVVVDESVRASLARQAMLLPRFQLKSAPGAPATCH